MVVLGWLPVKPCCQGLLVKPQSRYWRQTGVMHQQFLSRYAADGFTLCLFGLELPCSRCLYRLQLRGRGVYVRYTTANCSSAAYWVGQFVVGCRSVFRLVSLVHRLVPPIGVCSPPRASPDSYLWPASHISWTVFFADRLAWFRVLTSGEHGQFQSWRGDRISYSRCAHCWGSICEVPVLLKSGGRRPFAVAVCSCDESNMNYRFIFGQVPKVHIFFWFTFGGQKMAD